MEYIKNKFELKYTTGTTESGDGYKIIPDESKFYNIKLSLKSNSKNFGFFDVYDFSGGTDNEYHEITGETYSRLSEIEKSVQTGTLEEKYFISTDVSINGLDLNETISGDTYVYYIDGIIYVDDVVNEITYFTMQNNGLNSDNSIIGDYYKEPSIFDNVSKPIVKSDLFIDRPIRKVVNHFYSMKNINKMVDLENYAGGLYYNIYKND